MLAVTPTGQPNWGVLAQTLGLEHVHKASRAPRCTLEASVRGGSAFPVVISGLLIVCMQLIYHAMHQSL